MLNQAVHLPLNPKVLPGSAAATDASMALIDEFRRYYLERMLPVARVGLGSGLVASFVIRDSVWLPCLIAGAAGIAGLSAITVGALAARTGALDLYGSVIFSTLCTYLVLG